MRQIRILLAALLLLVPVASAAQERLSAVVTGRVILASDSAAAGVLVRVDPAGVATLTDSTGRYRLAIPAGRFADGDSAILLAVRVGLRRFTRVQLVAGREQTINVRLKAWESMADRGCVIVDPRGIGRVRSEAETRKLCAVLPSYVRTRDRGLSRSP